MRPSSPSRVSSASRVAGTVLLSLSEWVVPSSCSCGSSSRSRSATGGSSERIRTDRRPASRSVGARSPPPSSRRAIGGERGRPSELWALTPEDARGASPIGDDRTDRFATESQLPDHRRRRPRLVFRTQHRGRLERRRVAHVRHRRRPREQALTAPATAGCRQWSRSIAKAGHAGCPVANQSLFTRPRGNIGYELRGRRSRRAARRAQ